METELAEFEAALPDKAAAEEEKRDANKLGAFLKEQLQGRAMGNEEFFHHQLRERIAGDARAAIAPEKTARGRLCWPLGRLVWAGATSLAIFLCLRGFCHAREESNRSIAVSHADPERPSRSRGESERDDFDV